MSAESAQDNGAPPPTGYQTGVWFVRRHGTAVAAVLVALILVVVVPLGLASMVPGPERGAPPGSGDSNRVLPIEGSDGYPVQATTPASSLTGEPTAQSPTPRRTPSTSLPPSPTVAFAPVTFEAEAATNTLGGSAWIAPYPAASGGRIVRNLGDWGTDKGAGWLRFNNVSVPADGAYTLTFYNVHIDGSSPRSVVVAVSNGATSTVSVAGSSSCCAAHSIMVNLRKGANAITFGNPSNYAPSIDKIVISRS